MSDKKQPPDEQTSITTPGTRDGTPVAGTCPVCGRDELVTVTVSKRAESSQTTYADGTPVKDGATVTLCPLCNHALDAAEEKAGDVKKSTPKRSTAKRSTAKRTTAKRSTAKRTTAKRAPAKRTTAKRTSSRRR